MSFQDDVGTKVDSHGGAGDRRSRDEVDPKWDKTFYLSVWNWHKKIMIDLLSRSPSINTDRSLSSQSQSIGNASSPESSEDSLTESSMKWKRSLANSAEVSFVAGSVLSYNILTHPVSTTRIQTRLMRCWSVNWLPWLTARGTKRKCAGDHDFLKDNPVCFTKFYIIPLCTSTVLYESFL